MARFTLTSIVLATMYAMAMVEGKFLNFILYV